MHLLRLSTVALAILASAPAAAAGQQLDPRWQASVSTFVSEGDYGTSDTTNLVYTTLSVRRAFPRGDVTFRIPQMKVTTTGTVLVYRGVPQATPSGRQTTSTTPTRGGVTPAAPVPVRQTLTTTASGIGDVSVGARIVLVNDGSVRPAIDLTTRVELPTGDDARGLGLGAASAQFGVDVQKSLGAYVIALASGSFTATGRTSDTSLQNPWEYSAGMGMYLTRAVLLTGSYEQWRPVIPGTPMGRDMLATATVATGRYLRILASAQAPLSAQAPDFGAGLGMAVRF